MELRLVEALYNKFNIHSDNAPTLLYVVLMCVLQNFLRLNISSQFFVWQQYLALLTQMVFDAAAH